MAEGQTSPDRVVYQNADGSRTAEFFDGQVNYRLPDGSWARVDTSLIPAAGTGTGSPSAAPPLLPRAEPGRRAALSSPSPAASSSPAAPGSSPGSAPASSVCVFVVRCQPVACSDVGGPGAGGLAREAAAWPETFSAYADGSPLLVVPFGASQSVGLDAAGCRACAGQRVGGARWLRRGRPDAGLRLVAGAGLVDVQVVLDSSSAPDTWMFPLRLDGLTARTGPGGTIEFTERVGQGRGADAAGLMTDSADRPAVGHGAQSDGVVTR